MTSNTKNPDEIEREIEQERAGLSRTLDDLQERFSVEGVARQFTDQLREHGGDIGRSVSDAVKRNPVALAVTGVGLAWLMFGGNTQTRSRDDDGYSSDRRFGAVDRDSAISQDRNAERFRHTTQAQSSGYSHGRPTQGTVPSWARTMDDTHDNSGSMADSARSAASRVSDGVSGAASSVAGTAKSAGSSIASGARSAGDAVSSTGRAVADGVKGTAHSAADRASAMRARLAEGTDALSEDARERVIAARARAMDAWEATGRYTQQGRERAVDLFDEHPLIAGALAVAVGAAFGAALPRSRTEDTYLGEHRDALFHEAERIYAEEKEKLGNVAQAAKDEASKIARETKADADAKAPGETAVDAMVNKAKESGKRVADKAKSEADKQKLGDITS